MISTHCDVIQHNLGTYLYASLTIQKEVQIPT